MTNINVSVRQRENGTNATEIGATWNRASLRFFCADGDSFFHLEEIQLFLTLKSRYLKFLVRFFPRNISLVDFKTC